MVSEFEVADAHQKKVAQLSDKVVARGLRAWALMDFRNLDASWAGIAPALTSLVSAAQVSNAQQSNTYLAGVTDSSARNPVNANAFAGVDGSGRPVGGLLFGAVTTTKEAIGAGLAEGQSMLAGATYLAAMMKTAIHDVSRSSDLTAAVGHKYTMYVRVVQAGACSRCAILAGTSSYKKAFQRHPACKCSSYPVEHEDAPPAGFHASPEDYFKSLSPAEQDRVFTKSGAEAIRSGANPVSVVSARRGASGISYGNAIGRSSTANEGRQLTRSVIGHNPDGSPIMGYQTVEGTTRRGAFGRTQSQISVGSKRVTGNRYSSVKRTRLMPETIVNLTDDRELRTILLRDAGYIDIPYTPGGNRLAIAAADRAEADAFYRHLGIQLG